MARTCKPGSHRCAAMLWSPRLAPTSTMSPPLEIGKCSRANWYSSFGTSRLRRCSELSFGCCTSHMHRPSAIFTAVGGCVRLRSLRKLLRLPKSSLPNLLTSVGRERKSSLTLGGVLRQDEGVVVRNHVQTHTPRTTTRRTTTRHADISFLMLVALGGAPWQWSETERAGGAGARYWGERRGTATNSANCYEAWPLNILNK